MYKGYDMADKIDLRIIKTYDKLMNALCDMLHEMPFESITVFDLCERADIRRATFYKHFEDKYAFLSHVISTTLSDVSKKVMREKSVFTTSEYLTLYVRKIIDYFESKPDMLKNILARGSFSIIFESISTNTLKKLIGNLTVVESISGNELPYDTTLTANFINGGLATLVVNYIAMPNKPKEEFLRDLKMILDKITV